MSDDISTLGVGSANQLDSSYGATAQKEQKTDEIGKDEFLNLLVTQLKNQDPLDPMEDEDFAVNLAQFSQLEQLISINGKVGTGDTEGLSSLATYLGHQVTLSSQDVEVSNGDGGEIKFNLAQDATQVKVELLDANEEVVDQVELGEMSAGKQTAQLADLSATDGTYSFRITATGTSGGEYDVEGQVTGIVNGFIPGSDPVLLVGNREVAPADITEVNMVDAG